MLGKITKLATYANLMCSTIDIIIQELNKKDRLDDVTREILCVCKKDIKDSALDAISCLNPIENNNEQDHGEPF